MKTLRGVFLVASPSLLDPNFARAVVLILEHGAEGAMGVVINRPTGTTMAEGWKQVREEPFEGKGVVYHGGPCEGPLMVVHEEEGVGQIEIVDGLFLSTEAERVAELVQRNADPMKWFVGCAGWGPGQLEMELKEEAWLLAEATAAEVFATPRDQWARLTKRICGATRFPGLDAGRIPPDASVN